jgi:hypothetical protein
LKHHRNTALCTSGVCSRRLREIVECSGVCSATPKVRNSRNDKEPAACQAMPHSLSKPSM